VQEQLQQLTLETLAGSNIRTSEVLTASAEIAYLDPAACFDVIDTPQGPRQRLKTLTEMAPHVRRAVASVKVRRQPGGTGNGAIEEIIEIKFWSKTEALNLLARHKGLLRDVTEHQVTVYGLLKLSDEEFDRRDRESQERFERMKEARKHAGLWGSPAIPNAN
jgi:hypothetical protein